MGTRSPQSEMQMAVLGAAQRVIFFIVPIFMGQIMRMTMGRAILMHMPVIIMAVQRLSIDLTSPLPQPHVVHISHPYSTSSSLTRISVPPVTCTR